VITGEVSDPNTLDMLQRYAMPHVPRSRIISALARSIAHALASLIFTSK
jgi:hypothetical protein